MCESETGYVWVWNSLCLSLTQDMCESETGYVWVWNRMCVGPKQDVWVWNRLRVSLKQAMRGSESSLCVSLKQAMCEFQTAYV